MQAVLLQCLINFLKHIFVVELETEKGIKELFLFQLWFPKVSWLIIYQKH